ncbi:unnamed protein product [Didymodactylos carnosus]|uniref:Uncharacterized protein n=1 Tax=Didymodactylos carnosus TaxID=1234261 RepID=A0A814S789_9BILA|nr:unnamed protein product [Didymodactylos carnosus]CAF1212638.1 unnamed protein product [Didymodactylos carnosus]CAF3907179.1 unnamed protein product [Didymodactylos carnosus]CAF4021516.1 unnamed protein product [Didymodactylos carnosus]
MNQFDHLFRRFVVSQQFVRGWGNPQHLQELYYYRREKVGIREQCYKLVPSNYPIEILKEEVSKNQLIITGQFISPLSYYLSHLFVPEIVKAKFRLILPKDHKLGIDQIPIAINYPGTGDHNFGRRHYLNATPLLNGYRVASIILENPYYGSRKPADQFRSSLFYVTDLFVMGGALVLESLALLHWCERMKLAPVVLHGFSLGSHMASLAFTNYPKPLSLVSCLSWSTSSTVFCEGVISKNIPWHLLSKQFYENKAYRTFYDELSAKEQKMKLENIVTQNIHPPAQKFHQPTTNNTKKSPSFDIVKDFMRLLMDEFTHLKNYSLPYESNLSNALFIVATNDGYVLRNGTTHMSDLWPNCHVRYINHGHISGFLFNQSLFHKATVEMLEKQKSFYKDNRIPTSLVSG